MVRTASAELFVVLPRSGTEKAFSTLDPASGAATRAGALLGLGAIVAGNATWDSATDRIVLAGKIASDATVRLLVLDPTTGALASSAALSVPSGASSSPLLLEASGGTIYGLFPAGNGMKRLCSIDATTGVATAIGADLPIHAVTGGASTSANGELFLLGSSSAGAPRSIYRIDLATGVVLSNPPLTVPVGFSASPLVLERDETGGTLVALLDRSGDDQLFLATIDAATGAATTVGAGFDAKATTPGVSAFDATSRTLYFAANAVAASTRSIYGISATTGAATSTATIASVDGDGTTPLVLSHRGPLGIGDIGLLLVTKLSATDARLDWTAGCGAAAIDSAVYAGNLNTFYAHAPLACTVGGALTAVVDLSRGRSLYFLVAARDAANEGSLGTDSDGAEIPPASGACLPRLVGSCP